jgi:uncharacterized membrane protein
MRVHTPVSLALTFIGALALTRRRRWREVTLIDLLGSAGGPCSVAFAAAPGVGIVGSASARPYLHRDGRTRWLTDYGEGGEARAIDADGVVAGTVFSLRQGPRGRLWRDDTTAVLDPLPGHQSSVALGLANGSVAVGASVSASGSSVACWWPKNRPQELGNGPSGARGARNDLVVGWSSTTEGWRRPTVWGGGTVLLDTFGGHHGIAHDVNDGGVVVGSAEEESGLLRPAVWRDTTPTPLSTPHGGRGEALAVDDSGTVAGWVFDGRSTRAAVWRNGQRFDLGTLGGTTAVAHGLDGAGLVVGQASTGAGATGVPLRPGGWSWEDHAFVGTVPSTV